MREVTAVLKHTWEAIKWHKARGQLRRPPGGLATTGTGSEGWRTRGLGSDGHHVDVLSGLRVPVQGLVNSTASSHARMNNIP